MRRFISPIALALTLIVTLITAYHYSYRPPAKVGGSCRVDSDCQLPISYAIRSSCPFQAKYVNNSCAVTCEGPDVAQDVPIRLFQCRQDNDCNCSSFYPGQDIISCNCLSGKCHAVVSN